MNKENTEKLINDFPSLYRQYYLSMQETCMCWGFEVPDSWFDVIYNLSRELDIINKKYNACIEAVQVKEKFGSLRFYIDVLNVISDEIINKIDTLIYNAEKKIYNKENVNYNEVLEKENYNITDAEKLLHELKNTSTLDHDNSVYVSDEEIKLILKSRKTKKHEEYQYLHLLEDIMENGVESNDRTDVGTKKIFGTQLKFSLKESFPILTTKKVFWKGVVEELLWFIRGDTNANHLKEKNVHIWDGNTTREFLDKRGLDYPEGFIGPGYGWQWRNWGGCYYSDCETCEYDGIDQLSDVIDKLKNNPDDRRIIVSAWNPSQLNEMCLPPCHLLYQFQVSNGELHCCWYQRSVDCFLGLPFNISSYALLTCLMAKVANLTPGTVTFFGGDTHIYINHIEQVKEQLSRDPFTFPTLEIPEVKTIKDIENLTYDDCKLINYQSHKSIKADMAI